jgi:DNA helicase HerA-like ATPase
MYNQLVQFWHEAGNREFDLNDFEGYVNKIPESDLRVRVIKAGLMDRINVAKALNLFGPSNFIKLIKELQKTGGAVIIDLSKVTSFVRAIIVDFILRKLALLGQTKEIKPLSIFLEEAHLYVTQENIKNLVTRMRHFGIFPTFITNNPSTLPSEVFIQLDNLIAFRMKNEDELRHLAKVGLIDSDSIQALRNLEDKQCLLVGDISSNYPMFLQIEQQTGIMMGGETRKLLS